MKFSNTCESPRPALHSHTSQTLYTIFGFESSLRCTAFIIRQSIFDLFIWALSWTFMFPCWRSCSPTNLWKVNVFYTMEKLLSNSKPLRELVRCLSWRKVCALSEKAQVMIMLETPEIQRCEVPIQRFRCEIKSHTTDSRRLPDLLVRVCGVVVQLSGSRAVVLGMMPQLPWPKMIACGLR